jgi:peptidoglycan/LPS O-acetylase OafA/YrhL
MRRPNEPGRPDDVIHENSRIGYRRDIDGLRAVAILAVVFYHAFPSVFTGGFVGVDIFFVISGFLISSIIFGGVQRGKFSFTDFYAHRVKRIFPALIVVLAATFIFGWISLLADEFMQLGRHIAASAGFVENFLLLKEAGYFDSASALKPLMHLWSLAIEEQFYLVWPLLIWGSWRLGRRSAVMVMVIALGALSFTLNVVDINEDAVKAFFSPQTRFWELLAGSILAFSQGQSPIASAVDSGSRLDTRSRGHAVWNSVLSVIGLLLVLGSVFALREGERFPGWRAVFPVLGSFLLLLSGPDGCVNRKLLANGFMRFIGLISYPLYLWHWPLLSFLQIEESEAPSRGLRLCAVALSFPLAWLTYRFAERPIRFGRSNWIKTVSLCGSVGILGLIGYGTYKGSGLSSRTVVKLNAKIHSGDVDVDRHYIVVGCGIQDAQVMRKFANCLSDSRGAAKFALLGDSKAAALAPGLFMESTGAGRWLFIGGNGPYYSPVPVISDSSIYSRYQFLIRAAVDAIAKNDNIKVVTITSATRSLFNLKDYESIDELTSSDNFDLALSGLSRVVSALVKSHKKVVLTTDNPTFKDPKFCINRITSVRSIDYVLDLGGAEGCAINYDKHIALSQKYRELLRRVEAEFPGKVRIFDTLNELCDMKNRVCSSFFDDKLLYKFTDHISEYASVRIADRLIPFVEQFANENVERP